MSAAVLLEQTEKRYGRPLAALALRVWRRVRDEGGWWTASELALVLGEDLQKVSRCCCRLAASRYVAERVNPQTKLRRVGVTGFCFAPLGESLEPGRSPESWGA